MPLRTYWRLVAKRATKDARAALLIETGERVVVGAVVTITAIVLLWLYGSEGSPWDAALERVGPWIFIILAVYPVVWAWKFVKAPAQIDAELHERIDALETRLKQRLEFTWRRADNKYFDIVNGPRGNPTAIGRVAVKNLSEVESMYGVEVSLINYRRDGADVVMSVDKNLINNATNQRSASLHARREANFNLFHVTEYAASVSLGPFVGGGELVLQPGRYIIKVTASADNMKRENALFILEFDKHVSVRYRLLAPGNTSDEDAVGY